MNERLIDSLEHTHTHIHRARDNRRLFTHTYSHPFKKRTIVHLHDTHKRTLSLTHSLSDTHSLSLSLSLSPFVSRQVHPNRWRPIDGVVDCWSICLHQILYSIDSDSHVSVVREMCVCVRSFHLIHSHIRTLSHSLTHSLTIINSH